MPPAKPFQIVKDFEDAVAEYTGAPYCVAVNSCTMALRLCLEWEQKKLRASRQTEVEGFGLYMILEQDTITIPSRTYLSVPMQIRHAGFKVAFNDRDWHGSYQLAPFPIWDSARHFTTDLWKSLVHPYIMETPQDLADAFVCVSFHATKTLGFKRFSNPDWEADGYDIEQGGAILHNCEEADSWFRRMRFDGRTEGVAPKYDKITELGFHCYMNPSSARLGLKLLKGLPRHNPPLPNDDYADLSQMEIFK